jgi:methyl-accepting chemotaxis protein
MQINNQTIELILIALVAVAMVVQAIVLMAAVAAMRKAANSLVSKIEEFRSSVVPLVDKTREVFSRVAPKIEETADDLSVLTHALRQQTADVQNAADEIVSRARRQAGRIDTMLTNVLDALERAGGFMADTVAKPMRQVSALLASAKAVVESLRSSAPPPSTAPGSQPNHAPGDSDLYV